MRLAKIDTFAVRAPRDPAAARGGAGSPAALQSGSRRYSLAQTYGTVYSRDIETLVVKLTTTDGIAGWGEAQAPVAPEVVQEIVHRLIAPLLLGETCGSPIAVRQMLYEAMRVRGHFGGFYVDAVSAIDIALWDLAGKAAGVPLYRLLGGPVRTTLPVYVSGLTGGTPEEQIQSFEHHLQDGADAFKIFMAQEPSSCLSLVRELRRRSPAKLFVDALWRLKSKSALRFAQELAEYDVDWLEAPLAPEDIPGHRALARSSPIRIAIGESYRTRLEMMPFFQARALHVLQPDIGRCGVTEGNHLASLAESYQVTMAPHISIGLGPQIAAALHCAACWTNLEYVECNPQVYRIAERFQRSPFSASASSVEVPTNPGLGLEMNEEELVKFSRAKCASI